MNKENSKLIWISALLIFFTACASHEKVEFLPSEVPRVYETKAQIKSSEETNTVKIQIALAPQKAIRLEITGTLGVSIATVLVTPKQISLALHLQKSFISGPFNEKTLYPIFKQNISPRLIWKIINDQNPADSNWTCQVNVQLKPISCLSKEGMTANWSYEGPVHKRVDIKADKFEMNWLFKDQLQLPQYQNETFVLKKPEGYKEIFIK